MNTNYLIVVVLIIATASSILLFLVYDQEKNQPSEIISDNTKSDNSVRVIEKPYDARLVTEYDESIPIDHKNNVTDDELQEKLELVRNSGLEIVSSGIDYDVGQLVLYSPDSEIEDDIKKIIGDFPFILLYEEAPSEWEASGPPPLDS